ncbi:2-methylaconitate cis-trans isomerase PrpF [Alteromonas sediminis]|uniref:2-methylaconitate cis-trans isomerase PrpF n=1 Tax=Alteromonas sediminis TaxID=2259342 RepID=A0A3N5Y9F6_9ALTE|nr:2-methylaconitate cis-trans isomerase PrpF [Alteromonas sediminis]RPJ67879.1 2-methylaconitate cis-trans isomerase PrpF [Alteromonas sediminis]
MSQQTSIPATYMRGGTSKGVFFRLEDLPVEAQQPGEYRDSLLLRVIGSPDPYGKHTDGMGGATSSTSKTVILSKSDREDCDVNYLFGQVAIDRPIIDWSGNCGNLTAAVGVFAIQQGLVDASRLKGDNVTVRIWQQNIQKVILAKIQLREGQAVELGDFELDGVTFPAAEVEVTFMSPADAGNNVLPTGNPVDELSVEGIGSLSATMINSGIPTVFVNASDAGFMGTESQDVVNSSPESLQKLELIRAAGAAAMGIPLSGHIPKVAFVSPPKAYTASSGKRISEADTDLLVRAVSMGKLHHAMMGTAAVAIASAAAMPGTLLNQAAKGNVDGTVTFGHPSGTLTVGAEVEELNGDWLVNSVTMSRSARTLMKGHVYIPPV